MPKVQCRALKYRQCAVSCLCFVIAVHRTAMLQVEEASWGRTLFDPSAQVDTYHLSSSSSCSCFGYLLHLRFLHRVDFLCWVVAFWDPWTLSQNSSTPLDSWLTLCFIPPLMLRSSWCWPPPKRHHAFYFQRSTQTICYDWGWSCSYGFCYFLMSSSKCVLSCHEI